MAASGAVKRKDLEKLGDLADEAKGIKKAPEVTPNPVHPPEPKGKGRETEAFKAVAPPAF